MDEGCEAEEEVEGALGEVGHQVVGHVAEAARKGEETEHEGVRRG